MTEHHNDLRLVELLAEWLEVYSRACEQGLSDDARDAITDELGSIEERISSTPAGTIQGAAVKSGLLSRTVDSPSAMATSLYADIERLEKAETTSDLFAMLDRLNA